MPTAVLKRARRAAEAHGPAKSDSKVPFHAPPQKSPKDKVVAALRRLHPMD